MTISNRFRNSMAFPVYRRFVQATSEFFNYDPEFLLDSMAIARPNYAYCMLKAAKLGKLLGEKRISVIEFGVAGGNGLVFLVDFAKKIERATGVTVDCYGFDTGAGMPEPQGGKDLPYWFRAAQYRMNIESLERRVPAAKIIIGNINQTLSDFLPKYQPAPIGAIMNDVDYWSSTSDSLKLFDQSSQYPNFFLPRLFLYFDDIIGTDIEMYGEHNGQLAAISDFNARQTSVRIHRNQNLMPSNHLYFRWQIYYAHLFEHPRYGEYVGGEKQNAMEVSLKLR